MFHRYREIFGYRSMLNCFVEGVDLNAHLLELFMVLPCFVDLSKIVHLVKCFSGVLFLLSSLCSKVHGF